MEQWQDPEIIFLWILLGLGFLVMLLIFIIVLTRMIIRNSIEAKTKENQLKLTNQQQLIQASITAQEKERERLASDIHDGLISKLNGLKLQAEIQYASTASDIVDGLDRCIMTARRISHDLSPPLIEHSTLEDIVEEVIDPYRSTIKITAHYSSQHPVNHAPEIKIQVMRILEEVMVNTHKHAAATEFYLKLKSGKTHYILYARDNGKGFDLENSGKGLGLQNLQSRAQYLNGILKLRSKPNKGTSLLLCFPNP